MKVKPVNKFIVLFSMVIVLSGTVCSAGSLYVYGLLLFSKFHQEQIKTRTYIRFLSGDAIS